MQGPPNPKAAAQPRMLQLSTEQIKVYACMSQEDFEVATEGWPAKLVAKIKVQRALQSDEPKASAKAARLEQDTASDKKVKAQRAYDRAQEAVGRAVANAVKLKAELAAAVQAEKVAAARAAAAYATMAPADPLGQLQKL
eukprot:3519759-Pyramimonas_sp.AAC.1